MDQQERASFADKSPPTYEADDGTLNAEDIEHIRKLAEPCCQKAE